MTYKFMRSLDKMCFVKYHSFVKYSHVLTELEYFKVGLVNS